MGDLPIAAEGVSYEYGSGALRKQVLFDVELLVQESEIVILTGPSGSGKTTLLTLIGALRAAQQGSVRVLGQELRDAGEATLVSVRRQIGYIFQQHNLIEALSVRQNVQMALELGAEALDGAAERIDAVLAEVGIEDQADKHPSELSGGQQQRVGIARALVTRPRIVLADEPTASLDKKSGRDVVQLIQRLAREDGASVILVTHDNRILDVADRIVHFEDGHIQSMSEAVASGASRMLQLLDRHDPQASHYLAALSLALARVAAADRMVQDEERSEMRRVLSEVAELHPAEIDLVVEIATSHARLRPGASDALPALELDARRRDHLIRSLHAVAEADGRVTQDEQQAIEQIVEELGIRTR